MRRRVMAAAAVVTALTATFAVLPTAAGPGPGYFASDNVRHIAHIPLNNDAAGARLVGNYFYITTSRDLKIYDVSKPESPELVGTLIRPQMPYFAEEDVDTNGSILLIEGIDGASSSLDVIDVEDKSNPRVIGTMSDVDEHTMTCLLDCRWAWGNGGVIVDLRDPTRPRRAGNWMEGLPISTAHDVTEVAPGLVVTASAPILVLDATNPRRPEILASGFADRLDKPITYFWGVHGSDWPREAKDRFLMTAGESAGPDCDQDMSAHFIVWDTRGWKQKGSFRAVDRYRPRRGIYADGNPPADLLCGHWFDPHPRFHNGGLVALGWYDHGVRFLDVARSGAVKEVGHFMPVGGSMSAAYWVTDRIVYAVDYHRGLDVIEFGGR